MTNNFFQEETEIAYAFSFPFHNFCLSPYVLFSPFPRLLFIGMSENLSALQGFCWQKHSRSSCQRKPPEHVSTCATSDSSCRNCMVHYSSCVGRVHIHPGRHQLLKGPWQLAKSPCTFTCAPYWLLCGSRNLLSLSELLLLFWQKERVLPPQGAVNVDACKTVQYRSGLIVLSLMNLIFLLIATYFENSRFNNHVLRRECFYLHNDLKKQGTMHNMLYRIKLSPLFLTCLHKKRFE